MSLNHPLSDPGLASPDAPDGGLADWQRDYLLDMIGEAGACSDRECECQRQANLAQSILDGEENWEMINGIV